MWVLTTRLEPQLPPRHGRTISIQGAWVAKRSLFVSDVIIGGSVASGMAVGTAVASGMAVGTAVAGATVGASVASSPQARRD